MSQAGIINITSGGGGSGVLSIKGDDGTTVLPDGSGNIQLDGLVVANGTHPSKAVFTESPGVHIENIDIQLAAAIASSDVTKVGLASFDNTIFTVDSNGFVSELQANAVIWDFDDMINLASSGVGKLDWIGSGNSISLTNGTATNPGIMLIPGGESQSSGIYIDVTTSANSFVLGGGTLSMNFVFNFGSLSTSGNRYILYIGLFDSPSIHNQTGPINGCYFKYSDNINSGDWQIATTSSSTSTVNNTSTLAATGFYNYGIQVNALATSVGFTINGSTVASSPITTNIPTGGLTPGIIIVNSTGSTPNMEYDLFYYKQVLTTPR
jgi:hypothetical protein